MHLDDHPLAVSLFENACPAGVLPTNRLPVPLGVVVEVARIPGGVSHFGEFDAQVTDREIGGLELIPQPHTLKMKNYVNTILAVWKVKALLLKLFRQIVALMSKRKISQFAKNPIALALIKPWRLKTERVQKGVLCAAPPGFIFHKR